MKLDLSRIGVAEQVCRKTPRIIVSRNAGSVGALARIERVARNKNSGSGFSGLARAAHAFADEGVRAPSVKRPFQL